jgi:hypothetical protein
MSIEIVAGVAHLALPSDVIYLLTILPERDRSLPVAET